MITKFKLFEGHDDINNICLKYGIKNYIINDDGSIDVDDNVNLSYRNLSTLPLKFRNVQGNFNCRNNNLISLEGCPKSVGWYFDCRYNRINSMEGFPERLVNYFSYGNNPICPLVENWINRSNRHSMVEYFNDLDIIRDDGKTIILDRLEEFIDIFKVKVNLKEVEKYYKII